MGQSGVPGQSGDIVISRYNIVMYNIDNIIRYIASLVVSDYVIRVLDQTIDYFAFNR
jgi:hypothetical protein